MPPTRTGTTDTVTAVDTGEVAETQRGLPVWLAPTTRGRALILIGLGLLIGAAAFGLHARSWVGHNGDHFYYTSIALQFSGVPYDEAIHTATHYFDYPNPAGELDQGFMEPWFAPLMYPRNLLPLLATPFIKAFGVRGMWVPGIAFGVASLLGMVALAWRRVSPLAAAAVPVLLLGSVIVTEYMFGVFTEAPLIFLVTAMLAVFPLGRRRGWGHAWLAAALVPLMVLSRQVPVLPLAMVLGGWLWAAVRGRSVKNEWLPFVATVVPTAVVVDAVMERWAPFDPLQVLRTFTHGQTLPELLRGATPLFLRATRSDVEHALGHDLVGVALFALGMVGLVTVVKYPLAGVFAGALGSGLLSEFLSPSAVRFRYESPALPALAILAAVGVARLAALAARTSWTVPQIAGSPAPEAENASPRRWLRSPGWAGAAGAWSVVAVVVACVVALHRPASLVGAPQVQISRAEYGPKWPFTVASGTLTCAGSDYEVWFRASDGTRYALSGTAMSHSFLTPRAESIRAGTTTRVWYRVVPVLSQGMRLCGRPFAGTK
jgi:Protein of unknown function (DUF2511)